MNLTVEQLHGMVPRADTARWLDPLSAAMTEFGIDSTLRIAGFIGQCAHESGDFNVLVENLNYGADGLANTWPARYSTGAKHHGRYLPNTTALTIARRPDAIANHTYANRLGNGDEASGDGWRYRGRGLMMLTGWDNYNAASRALRVDYLGLPELVAQPPDAARVSAWWFVRHDCLAACDDADWLGLSKIINTGSRRSAVEPVGAVDRETRIQRCLAALTATVV